MDRDLESSIANSSHTGADPGFTDTAIIIGHVGDGNFHIFTGVDPSVPDEVDDIKLFAAKVALKILELGGTCTGEHGIGLGKAWIYFPCETIFPLVLSALLF